MYAGRFRRLLTGEKEELTTRYIRYLSFMLNA